MIALIVAVFTACLALAIPNGSPYVRVWRPSFLLSAFSVFGLIVTWQVFTFASMHPIVPNLYAAGLVSFLLGDWVTSLLVQRSTNQPAAGPPSFDDLIRWPPLVYIYGALVLVGMVLITYVYLQRSAMFNMFELGTALRYAESIAQLPTYGAYHFLLFAQALGSVFVVSRSLPLRLIGYFCFGVLILASFVAVTRTTLFFSMGALAFLMYARTQRIQVIAVPAALMAILTFYYAVFAGKDQAGTGESFFVWYTGYAIHAFNQFILPLPHWDYGLNSLGTIGSIIHGGITPEDLSIEGREYNVYTFIGSPYRDFGTWGVIAFPFIFSCIWSLVWNRTGDRPIYTFMYAWMIFPCIIPFLDWKFNLTSYLYLIPIFALLIKPAYAFGRGRGPNQSAALQPAL